VKPILLVTRPAGAAERTAAAARKAGFAAWCAPLLQAEPLSWAAPEYQPEALLFTSAVAPPIVARSEPQLRARPAWAVGAATARAARRAGFEVAGVGGGDGSAIVAQAAHAGVRSLLHLGGADRAALEVPPGLRIDHRAIYAMALADRLPQRVVDALGDGRIFATLLFSPRTAGQFARLAADAGLAPAMLRIVALSEAVAAAAGPGWRATAVAARPDEAEALAAGCRL
jgi:uroporphyrinogen-III synthase